MSDSQVFLDISVPMYAAGRPHACRDACVWIMTEIAEGRIVVAIDTEIIQEVLYRYGALQRWDIAVAMASDLLDLIPTVHPIRLVDVRLALELFERYAPQGVSARDVIHAAVMQNNDMIEIISTDEHFDRIAGIRRLDPRELYALGRR
jgi:predicted nucleic acid-binding protein